MHRRIPSEVRIRILLFGQRWLSSAITATTTTTNLVLSPMHTLKHATLYVEII